MTQQISLDEITEALRHGGRIDASNLVLGLNPATIDFSNPISGAHRPPFLMAAFEFGPDDAAGDASAWTVDKFERLSLAARVALTLSRTPQTPKADDLRADAKSEGFNLDAFPIVDPEDILQALAWTADELGPDQGRGGTAETSEQLAMRGGLQLIGCRIKSTRNSNDGLRLVNARLPVSLRLIGCVIECPVLLTHCHLVSVDLSGSAMDTLEATGLIAAGSVHLRRTLVRTPVSFATARISGSFDAADAVIAPFARSADQVPLDPDHGMLNLSKITIDNDVLMQRARIWGGLSLRGANLGRSLFLDDALLISPLGMMEKCLGDWTRQGGVAEDALKGLHELSQADARMAARLHRQKGGLAAGDRISPLERMEILDGETDRWRRLPERTLSRLRARAMMSSVRADGARVDGSIFARELLAHGLFRMKYARVAGGMHLTGTLFRSADSCREAISAALEHAGALQALVRAEKAAEERRTGTVSPPRDSCAEPPTSFAENWKTIAANGEFVIGRNERPEVALDLRDSRFQGDVVLGNAWSFRKKARRARETGAPSARRGQATVYGVLLLNGIQVAGSLQLQRVRQRNHPAQAPSPPRGGKVQRPFLQRVMDECLTHVSFPSEGRRDWPWTLPQEDKMRTARRDSFVSLKGAVIGRDLDLRGTRGVHGVDLENAEIGADLLFSNKSSGRMLPEQVSPGFVECANRARRVRGTINLRSATIGGDAYLLFDPRKGPTIVAGAAKVAGRLDIYPQVGATSYQVRDPRLPPVDAEIGGIRSYKSGFWLDTCDHSVVRFSDGRGLRPPGMICRRCRFLTDKVDDQLAWFIDLRHASATVFSHPPAAWPDPGGLSLEGFSYIQTSDLGPLAPKPPLVGREERHYERARRRFAWRRHPGRQALVWVAGISALLAGWLSLTNWMYGRVTAFATERAWVFAPELTYLSIAAALLSVSMLSLFIPPGLTVHRTWPFVRNDAVAPRALEYLRRQRVAENRFKWRPAGYHALDTYVRASKALRSAGRYISANIVEEQRLRLRTEMLSWRHHGPIKLVLLMVDVFAGYGFRLARAMVITGLIIWTVAVTAYAAAAHGLLERRPNQLVAEKGGVIRSISDERPVCGTGKSSSTLDQDCPSLIYAADLLLPFTDFGEEERWKPTVRPIETELRALPEPLQSLRASLVLRWPAFVSVLGLLLSAIIGAAAAARIESAFARVEE